MLLQLLFTFYTQTTTMYLNIISPSVDSNASHYTVKLYNN